MNDAVDVSPRKNKMSYNLFIYTYSSFRSVRFENIPAVKIDKLLEDTILQGGITDE